MASEQTAAGLIHQLEEEWYQLFAPLGGDYRRVCAFILQTLRKNASEVEQWHWDPQGRARIEELAGDLCQGPTCHEVLEDRLRIIWADAKFWRIIRTPQKKMASGFTPDDMAANYVCQTYHLVIPFQASLWIDLIDKPIERAYLFSLIVLVHSESYFWLASRNPKENLPPGWRAKLAVPQLGGLLFLYVQFPACDWRPTVAAEKYPREVLKWLHASIKKLATDLAYLINHPNSYSFDPRRAPPIPHRIRNLGDVYRLERMASKLREQPSITDYMLAKEVLGSIGGGGRKLARESRFLAHYRDQIPVVFHRSKGTKPPSR
jgi:hypothetical protein